MIEFYGECLKTCNVLVQVFVFTFKDRRLKSVVKKVRLENIDTSIINVFLICRWVVFICHNSKLHCLENI